MTEIPAFLNIATPGMFAAGAAMTAGPVIIHLLNKRRFKILEWAAMEFLLESLKQNRRRLQAEEILLLLVRMTILTLMGLALAKPMLPAAMPDPDTAAALDAAAKRTDHFIVIDDSVSTGQVARGETGFDAIRKNAKAIILKLSAPERRLDTLTVLRVSQFGTPEAEAVADAKAAKAKAEPKDARSDAKPEEKPESKADPKTDAKPAKADDLLPPYTPDIRFAPIEKKEDAAAFADQVGRFTMSDTVSRLDLALRAVRELAAGGAHPNKRIYVLSDSRERDAGRGAGRGGEALRDIIRSLDVKNSKVLLQDVGSEDGKNAAITAFTVSNATVIQGVVSRVEVTVQNFNRLAPVLKGDLKITIRDRNGTLAERNIARDLATFGSVENKNGTVEKTDRLTEHFDLALDKPGPTPLIAELNFKGAGDTLEADNRSYLTLDVRPDLPVLLVHDPLSGGATGEKKSTFFLFKTIDFRKRDEEARERARREGKSYSSRLNGARADERSLVGLTEGAGKLRFRDYDLLVFANVSTLEDKGAGSGSGARIVRELENYVRNGGNVVFFLGDKVDARFYNDLLYKNGEGLLPVRLDREFKEPSLFRRLVVQDGAHRVFGGFKDSALSPLLTNTVKVTAFWTVEGSKAAAGSRTIVSFDDPAGSPAWVEKSYGAGKVLAFLSGPDKQWNDFPDSTAYPIIMTDLVAYMTRSRQAVAGGKFVGTPIETDLPDELGERGDAQVRLYGPLPLPAPAEEGSGAPAGPARPTGEVELGRVPVQTEKDKDGKVVRTFARVTFPFAAGETKYAPRAGFYRLDWSAPGVKPDPKVVTEVLAERNIDPRESDLARPDKVLDLFADIKDAEGKPVVIYHGAVDADTGRPTLADPGVFEPAAKIKGEDDKPKEDKELFFWLLGGLMALLLIEQFLAFKFSHHE